MPISQATREIPVAMTIAGADSSGGAGIAADLKTFAALGVHGTCAITAVTAQNTRGVQQAYPLPPSLVGAQIDSIITDLPCHAAKTGMLATAEIGCTVAERVRTHNIHPLVVDPVMVAASGGRLIDEEAVAVLVAELFPLAEVITPNIAEASALLSRPVEPLEQIRAAASELCELGPRAVIITGGHLPGEAIDVLVDSRTGQTHELTGPRVATAGTHGSGCTFAAALAAELAKGADLLEATEQAKQFTTEAIAAALPIGEGAGPVNPGALVSPQ